MKEEKAYFNFLVEDTGGGHVGGDADAAVPAIRAGECDNCAETRRKRTGAVHCKKFRGTDVRLHFREIEKGEGTTFVVSIPFEFEQAAEPEITEQPVENGLSVVQEEQAVYDFAGKKVLLAEDTAFNEEVATELLAMVHMDVDCAHNGKEAVELFEKAKARYLHGNSYGYPHAGDGWL